MFWACCFNDLAVLLALMTGYVFQLVRDPNENQTFFRIGKNKMKILLMIPLLLTLTTSAHAAGSEVDESGTDQQTQTDDQNSDIAPGNVREQTLEAELLARLDEIRARRVNTDEDLNLGGGRSPY